ncbi:MAG: hypothetical protein COV33_01350 [Candidatus Zambryskibacteria bacterium CG10_big_fil_rev_8_21_14_0_10_34_34]|uniref:Uncharacterized protein n=1 Tax=Candidatus Zambryskibacteria bacterium CG10_big_fil_rev_8_21_14_0_10_34_34 TaxID=1975114 RepID=A0A2H0R1L6_9BACT|nr:MAG: hypothetical protein COV33_01350 [Candidatus Zambryskibacteria bacterium CG10_big_fil_rev_8_21_14_0_10_34_34]
MIKIIKSDCVYIVRIKSKFNFMYDEKEVDELNEVDEYEEETGDEEEEDGVVKKAEGEEDEEDDGDE